MSPAVKVQTLFSGSQLRTARVSAYGSVDGIAIHLETRGELHRLYLSREEAARLCFRLHTAVMDSHKAVRGQE